MSTTTITVPLARGMEAAEHGTKPHCLGTPGKAKGYPVQIHDGMRSTNPHTGASEWGGHGASYDANAANPLNAGPPRGKRYTETKPVPGQRSRINDPVGGGVVVNGRNPAHDAAMLNADQLLRNSQQLAEQVLFEAANARGTDASDRAVLGVGRLPDAVTEE